MAALADYDVVILGAGGAGLMCAGVASQQGFKVLVIDHADKPGKKILISGGGRCNFTNLDVRPERFLSRNPHFAKSALARYTQHDFLELVERYGIAWHEKTLGQLFCDGSAKQIVQMLLAQCADAMDLRLGESVSQVTNDGSHYVVKTDRQSYRAPNLVVATGGPSIPKMGATDFAYLLARQFGLKIVEPRPALVPLTLSKADTLFRELSGVATETICRTKNAAFREAALFTHKGLSGPAILQVSSYWQPGNAVQVDFLPDLERGWLVGEKRGNSKQRLRSILARHLPERLAETLVDKLGFGSLNLADCKDVDLETVERKLSCWDFKPDGTEGYAKAEVTLGGVSTAGLSSSTMEAKSVPGLYFIGEAVDVTGWLGGYNFQWAWSSGWAAAKAIKKDRNAGGEAN